MELIVAELADDGTSPVANTEQVASHVADSAGMQIGSNFGSKAGQLVDLGNGIADLEAGKAAELRL